MTTTVPTTDAATPELQALLSAVENYVAESSVTALSGPQLAAELRTRERLRRIVSAADHALILEVERRGIAIDCGARSMSGYLQDVLHLTPGEANGRVRAASALGAGLSLSGQPMPPLLPATAAAHHDGSLSAAHIAAILAVMEELTTNLTPGQVAEADQILAAVAVAHAPKQVSQVGQRLIDTVDPDGPEPADEPIARRGLSLHRRRDGWLGLSGRLSPECAAEAEAVLNALAAPRPEVPTPGGVSEPDRRTPDQRRHDAFQDLLGLALRADTLPITGRRAQLIVTTTEADPAPTNQRPDRETSGAADRADAATQQDAPEESWPAEQTPPAGHARPDETVVADARAVPHAQAVGPDGLRLGRSAYTSFDQRLPRQIALELCDTAMLASVALTRTGAVLDYGQTRRFASKAQLRALIARDGGCSFPGCDHPPEWCDAHHVIAWIDRGPTAVTNLTLLCGYHHRNFHRTGWTCRFIDGVPAWIPPPHIDPDRRPQRHHRYLLRHTGAGGLTSPAPGRDHPPPHHYVE